MYIYSIIVTILLTWCLVGIPALALLPDPNGHKLKLVYLIVGGPAIWVLALVALVETKRTKNVWKDQ